MWWGYSIGPLSERNTLVGFATIRIRQLRLVVHDVALHQPPLGPVAGQAAAQRGRPLPVDRRERAEEPAQAIRRRRRGGAVRRRQDLRF